MLRCFRLDSSRTNRRARSKSGPLDKAQGGRVWGLRHPSSLRSGRATLPPPRYIVGDTYWSRLTASRSRTAGHKGPKNRPRARPTCLPSPCREPSADPVRATGSRSDAMGPFLGGHDGHERCLEVAYTVPSSEPHSRPKPWPGAAAAAPTPACLRSTDRTLWGSAGGVLYLLARVGSWAIDLVPSRHPYVARRARERRLCQEWGAQTGPAGAATAGFERAKNRSRQSTKASKRFGPAAGFLLASARDLRFSPGAIQQGNVGLLGTQNGITRSAARRVKTPDLVLSYTDPVLIIWPWHRLGDIVEGRRKVRTNVSWTNVQ